jgi:glucans biosynthesis protein
MNYFQVTNLKGFGLMQRDTRFDDFSDAEAHYEKRPSAWIDNTNDWGSGEVVLVEIPTSSEANDNIVAFWKPREKVEQGAELSFQYRLRFGKHTAFDSGIGRVVDTWVGAGRTSGAIRDGNDRNLEGTWRVVVDFEAKALSAAAGPVVSEVSTNDNASILEHFVEHLPEQGIWRLSMLVRPAPNNGTPLRARLLVGPNAVSETWLYQLPDLAQARQ